MKLAACWPGAANQKSVPGLPQPAVTTPPEVCSAARPCAMAPLAWTITPPGWPTGVSPLVLLVLVLVDVVLPVLPLAAAEVAGEAETADSESVPGCDTLTSGAVVALPVADSLLIVAWPGPERAAAAITATPWPRLPGRPGAGQPRRPVLTLAVRSAAGGCAADTVTGLLSQATPHSAASARAISPKMVNLFAGIFTGQPPGHR